MPQVRILIFALFILILLMPLSSSGVIIIGEVSADGPNAPILWAMDFENSTGGPGGRGCADTDGDTCSHFGGGVTGAYTTSPAPLEGTYSALKGIGYMYADSKFDNGTNDVTMDFSLNMTEWQTEASNIRWIALEETPNAYKCAIIGRPSNGDFWAYTSFQSGGPIAVVKDVEYRVRMEFRRSDGRCRIFVDTTATAWGTGAVGISDAIRADWGGTVTGIRSIVNTKTDFNYIIDDIAVCEGVAIVGKCGD